MLTCDMFVTKSPPPPPSGNSARRSSTPAARYGSVRNKAKGRLREALLFDGFSADEMSQIGRNHKSLTPRSRRVSYPFLPQALKKDTLTFTRSTVTTAGKKKQRIHMNSDVHLFTSSGRKCFCTPHPSPCPFPLLGISAAHHLT